MKFYTPEDFLSCECSPWLHSEKGYQKVMFNEMACNVANAKLEALGIPAKLTRLEELEAMIKQCDHTCVWVTPDNSWTRCQICARPATEQK